MMKYLDDIQNARSDPKSLETLYRAALEENVGDEFKSALLACYEEAPANVLYETWFYRLEGDERTVEKAGRGTNWKLAIPLAVLNGLIFWLLSHEDLTIFNRYPHLFLLWSPIAAIFAMAFLVIAGKREKLPSGLIGLGVLVLPAYVLLFVPVQRFFLRNYYLDLMLMHVPLLVWIGVGRSVLGPKSDPKSRLAFVIKTFEVIVTGGLFIIAGGIFSGITVGMFQALNIDIPEAVLRLFFAGGFGALPVIVVASVYNPLVKPAAQTFGQGVSRLMPTLVRLLLPLTLVVLVIYVALIPFNFLGPFENRDVLIVYNMMLFAIMGLLLGATPLQEKDVPPKLRDWVRRGIIAVAALAVLIGLYALSATVYRTVQGRLTLNRMTIIGWNVTNIGILVTLIFKQIKHGREKWVASLQSTFGAGSVAYLIWGLFVILAIPHLFR